MIELYKKTRKSLENPLGSKKIENGENPFKKPVILCISAQDHIDKSVFGITKNCMSFARLRTSSDENARFKVEDFPASFLSIRKNTSNDVEKEDEAINQFVDEYFDEIIMKSGEKIPVEQIQKNLRNINMVSYCNGTMRALKIVNEIQKRMEKAGYSNEEINNSISQISLVTLSTEMKLENEKCTIVDFRDLKDEEIEHINLTRQMVENTLNSPINECMTKLTEKNRAEYTFIGTGEHRVAQFKTDGKALPAVVSKVLGNSIENSIENEKSHIFKPLSIDNMIDGTDNIISEAENGKTRNDLIKEVDNSLYYGGAPKYSENECKLLNESDMLYKKNEELKKDLKNKIEELDEANKKITNVKEIVKENATDATYAKVLDEIEWSYFKQNNKINAPSDRDIIKSKDEQISKLQSMLNKTLTFADKVRKSKVGKLFFKKDIKALPQATEKEFEDR